MRRAGRKDVQQAAIVAALRQIGVTVRVVNQKGLPDLLVYSSQPMVFVGGFWLPVEVKSPGEGLTPAQQALYAVAKFPIVETPAEALALFGVRTT